MQKKWIVAVSALFALACDEPRTCVQTTELVDLQTRRIAEEHAAPCIVDAECVVIADDIVCEDGVVALGGCGRTVLASQEDDARAALDAFRNEVCSIPRESCARDVDCGEQEPSCSDGVCRVPPELLN